jgi:hypothetical protein
MAKTFRWALSIGGRKCSRRCFMIQRKWAELVDGEVLPSSTGFGVFTWPLFG